MSRSEFEQLLHRGYRYALSLTHEVAQAEDLLQEAWLACSRAGRPVPTPGYLFAAIRNRFTDELRRSTRFPQESIETDDRVTSGMPLPFSDPRIIDRLTMEQAIGALRSEEREAIFLQAVEGYTVREVAELTHTAIGTVSSYIQRGKRKLRAILASSSAEVGS